MNSLQLRRCLRAISGTHDDELKHNNLNPNALRTQFYVNRHGYEKPVDAKHEAHAAVPQDHQLYLLFALGNVGCSCVCLLDDMSMECDHHEFLLVTKKQTQFQTAIVTGKNLNSRFYELSLDVEYSLSDLQPANFVDIANKYGFMIQTICDYFGYDNIIAWIRADVA